MDGSFGQIVRRVAVALAAVALACPALCDVTGADVRRALRQGVQAIERRQLADGTWTERHQPGGETCLATFALLQAGASPDEPHIARAIERIRALPNEQVYTVSVKIMVLTRADPAHHRVPIAAAVRWLIEAQNKSGLWSYRVGTTDFDHSNSQFALLGLHAASVAGFDVPDTVWKRAQRKVLDTQNADGGWGYRQGGPSYGSMTAAGVADLLIVGHRVEQGREHGFRDGAAARCGRYRTDRALTAGLNWLAQRFQAGTNPAAGATHTLYWLYAVERCGILSGQRYIGTHDWYKEGVEYLVRRQAGSGLWNNQLVDTCFAVLFLAKGHQSLLIQKLKWSEDDAWSPDRYDVAHLVAYIGDQLGEPVAWQTVLFDAPLEDWLAAPILYFHGHDFPRWDAPQRAKLRAYVENGGTLLAEACCGSEAFTRGFEQFARLTFPEVALRDLGPEHAVYRLLHAVGPDAWPERERPRTLKGIDLGCRTSVIFSPNDLSCLWEQADVPHLSEPAFKLGTNIAAYAVGRRPLRDRLDAVVLPRTADQAGIPPLDAFRLAQVVYDGDWQPFPLALVRLAEFLRDELNLDVITQYRPVRLAEAELRTAPVLYMAGHYRFELPAAERAALANHLKRGGFLIADACCGGLAFDEALRSLVERMFPDARLERLPPDHPILAGRPGFPLEQVRYSPDVARSFPDLHQPELWGLEHEGRLAIVYSPFSLGCGLSGPAFEGCWGLESEDARRLAANIVLYALTH